MDGLIGDQPLEPVEPAYRQVLGARLLLFWLVLSVAAIVFDRAVLAGTPLAWLLAVLVPVVGVSTVLTAPSRIYARLGFRLTGRILQVVRGWLFHTDTVVPLVRVQHIDVTRGPLDKMFGTASLIVHTAGTHNSIVALPGLSPARAAEIRDAIREHVRTDFV
jgi:membrane protein YdbS with pleckstrin-like domain